MKTRTDQTQLESEWLTYRQAQQISNLGRTTLWNLARQSEIKVARVGRAVRISRESLEKFMECKAQGVVGRGDE